MSAKKRVREASVLRLLASVIGSAVAGAVAGAILWIILLYLRLCVRLITPHCDRILNQMAATTGLGASIIIVLGVWQMDLLRPP